MAEGLEPYHVPQQSRRDKLRVVAQNQPASVDSTSVPVSGFSAFLPFYDPSLLISSDLLSATADSHGFPPQTNQLSASAASGKNNPICVIKEEGMNFMGFNASTINEYSSFSSSTSYHPYLNSRSSLPFNPSSIQDMSNNPFLYTPQTLQNPRDFDQSYNTNGAQVMVYKPEASATGQGLSLSLSFHNTHQNNNNPLGRLNLQRYDPAPVYSDNVTATGYVASSSNEVSRSSVPLGPFTGYATVLKGSRFLTPAQQLLEELCDVGKGNHHAAKITPGDDDDPSFMEPPSLHNLNDTDDGESRGKKSRLISLLDEIYRRYKQYHQQMQAVVASFECVPGLGNATPFANLALNALSKQFRCLKNAIAGQLQFPNKGHGQISPKKDEGPRLGSFDRSLYNRPLHNSGFLDHQPVWRPQRGLPKRAVTVLRAWLFEHFLHPYPTDTDKLMLAKQTGLSRSQVSNWFINARVRIWKPMVEEIYMLETRQARKASQKDRNGNKPSDHSSTANSLSSEYPVLFTQRVQDVPSERMRSELPAIPVGREPLDLPYNGLLNHQHATGVGIGMGGGSGGGVSLTLGLHQNNGVGLSEPFPINAAVQRFGMGLEVNGEGYVVNRHFGRDAIGGATLA